MHFMQRRRTNVMNVFRESSSENIVMMRRRSVMKTKQWSLTEDISSFLIVVRVYVRICFVIVMNVRVNVRV